MDTITATVIGAHHLRSARNGQDAAVAASGPGWVAAVVCDGCSGGAWSEVGARLGAALAVAAIARRLAAGEPVDPELWANVRCELVDALAGLVDRMCQMSPKGEARKVGEAGELGDFAADRVRVVTDHFLFTIVAVAATREAASVWAIGDGTYAFDACTRTLGPFTDNQPPYLGYALLGDTPPAHVEAAPADTRTIAIGTDGALELAGGLSRFTEPRYLAHADRARRELAVLAFGREVIAWDERRVTRTAELHDDCAIAVVRVP
jgi:hypothetical protein